MRNLAAAFLIATAGIGTAVAGQQTAPPPGPTFAPPLFET